MDYETDSPHGGANHLFDDERIGGSGASAQLRSIERSLAQLTRSMEQLAQLQLLHAVEIAEQEAVITNHRARLPATQGGRLARWSSRTARWLQKEGA